MTSFDRIAPHYDFLARLVFGKSITQSQEYYLKEIKEGDRILILGGGTGWILDSIYAITKPGEIWYVDSSMKMLDQASAREVGETCVHFIQDSQNSIPSHIKFDVVITNFFLDMFPPKELPEVIKSVSLKLKPKGVWLCTDFVETGKWKHSILLKSMFFFFNLIANLKNNLLADWHHQLIEGGLSITKEKSYFDGFIKATVFKKAH